MNLWRRLLRWMGVGAWRSVSGPNQTGPAEAGRASAPEVAPPAPPMGDAAGPPSADPSPTVDASQLGGSPTENLSQVARNAEPSAAAWGEQPTPTTLPAPRFLGQPPLPSPLPTAATDPPRLASGGGLSPGPQTPTGGPPTKRASMARVTIGLDYGTSSTKVAIRDADNPAVVVPLDGGCQGFEWFATPSSVRVEGDRLWFGSDSRTRNEGVLYENLKVALLTQRATGLTADLPRGEILFLVAAHLTWCLASIRRHLDVQFGIGGYRPSVHVAAPMSQTGSPEQTAVYDRLLHTAMEAVFAGPPLDATLPWSRTDLENRIRPMLAGSPLPDLGERRFRVSPETLAPFVSLLQDRGSPLGMHILVDVGAATTEVLVVKLLPRTMSGKRFVAYLDRTEWVGGNDFQPHGSPASCKRLERHIRTTLYEAFAKDRGGGQDPWRQLTLLMSGGGVLHAEVRDVLEQQQWLRLAMQQFETKVTPRMHHPSEIDLRLPAPRSAAGLGTRRNFHMLANAHGLSVPWQKWDECFRPHEVEPLKKHVEPFKPPVDWEHS